MRPVRKRLRKKKLGEGRSCIHKLERTLRVGFTAGLAMGSFGLTCNVSLQRLKTSACLSSSLAADGHVLYLSCTKPPVAIETYNVAYFGTLAYYY